MIYCSTPCLDNVGNYITIYAGYNEDGDYKKFCGSVPYKHLYITGLYAYIKFHTNSEVNFGNLTGFSKVKFTAQGSYLYYKEENSKISIFFRYQ